MPVKRTVKNQHKSYIDRIITGNYICAGCGEEIRQDILLYGLNDREIIFSCDNMIPVVNESCPYKHKEKTGEAVIWHVTAEKDLRELLGKAKEVISGVSIDKIIVNNYNNITQNGEYEKAQKSISDIQEIVTEVCGEDI